MYRNSKSVSVLFFVATLLGMLLPSLASALGTPDGLPPPMETICDTQTGAAYGLCNAYCEAMDCDSDSAQASTSACEKVFSKFNQITGALPPCELQCPLVNQDVYPYFSGVVKGEVVLNRCARDSNWIPEITGVVVWSETDTPSPPTTNNPDGSPAGAVWIAYPSGGGVLYSGGDGGETTQDLSLEQYGACKGLLETAITSTPGLVCDEVQ